MLAATGALAVAVGGCGSSSATSANNGGSSNGTSGGPNAHLTTINVAAGPFAAYAPLWVGIDEGIFKKYGLKVDPHVAESGSAVVAGLVSGAYQFGAGDTVSTLTASSKGLPLRAVAMASAGGPNADSDYSCLDVKQDSPIKALSELQGKTVAVNQLNGIIQIALDAVLARNSVNYKTVKYVDIATPDEPVALAQGKVDAVAVSEPFCSVMAKAGDRSLAAPYAQAAPDLLTAAWLSTQNEISASPSVAAKFAKAMSAANVYAESHPAATRAAVLQFTSTSKAEAEAMKLPTWYSGLRTSGLSVMTKLARQSGAFSGNVNLSQLQYTESGS